MNFDFDFNDLRFQQLCVAYDKNGVESFVALTVDDSVQNCLSSMLWDTASRFSDYAVEEIPEYELAEKYSAEELVRASLGRDELSNLKMLYDLEGLRTDNEIINTIQNVTYYLYFAIDTQNRKLLGVKKAQHFKGLAGAQGRLISWIDDSLKLVEKPVFKLDRDFDLLLTGTEVFAIRPNALAFVAEVGDRATAAAAARLSEIADATGFLDLTNLQPYVSCHKRGAHLTSSIASRQDLDRLSKDKVISAAQELGIQLMEVDGLIGPAPNHELSFLELLDSRRYVTSLTNDAPQAFVAQSRRPVVRR